MRLDGLIKIIEDALKEYGNTLVDDIKTRIRQEDKLSTGNLYESIKFNIKTANGIIKLSVFAKDYLVWVEKGRKPGSKQPPVKAILKWIRARGITPSGIPIPKKKGLPKVQKQLAFMIANSIKRKGIAATPIVEPVLEETYSDFVNNLQVELAGELTKEIYSELIIAFGNADSFKVKNNLNEAYNNYKPKI